MLFPSDLLYVFQVDVTLDIDDANFIVFFSNEGKFGLARFQFLEVDGGVVTIVVSLHHYFVLVLLIVIHELFLHVGNHRRPLAREHAQLVEFRCNVSYLDVLAFTFGIICNMVFEI